MSRETPTIPRFHCSRLKEPQRLSVASTHRTDLLGHESVDSGTYTPVLPATQIHTNSLPPHLFNTPHPTPHPLSLLPQTPPLPTTTTTTTLYSPPLTPTFRYFFACIDFAPSCVVGIELRAMQLAAQAEWNWVPCGERINILNTAQLAAWCCFVLRAAATATGLLL